jgi:DNA-binding transcriptional regulator YhcF (GntR family)
MQLWFARGSEVTIREQLVTQVILGILSDDLAPGQRLPSTRELARRFRLHPNTVSAGYRQLERERWVEFRHGSGVYVGERKPELAPSSALALDQLILRLFRSARELGAPLNTVRSRLRQWLELQPPDPPHPQRLSYFLVFARIKSRIGGHHARDSSQPLLVHLDRGQQ